MFKGPPWKCAVVLYDIVDWTGRKKGSVLIL